MLRRFHDGGGQFDSQRPVEAPPALPRRSGASWALALSIVFTVCRLCAGDPADPQPNQQKPRPGGGSRGRALLKDGDSLRTRGALSEALGRYHQAAELARHLLRAGPTEGAADRAVGRAACRDPGERLAALALARSRQPRPGPRLSDPSCPGYARTRLRGDHGRLPPRATHGQQRSLPGFMSGPTPPGYPATAEQRYNPGACG